MASQTFVPVPEHNHTGSTDGSQCELCQFYQRGYWTGTDALLDYSRRTYRDGLEIGRSTMKTEYRDAVMYLLRCFIAGALIGLAVRAIADAQKEARAKTLAA